MTLFTKIIKGEIPCHKIYEDEYAFAFLDISPVSEGHTLVIPKDCYENFFDIPSETVQAMIPALQKVIRAVKTGMNADGITLLQRNGKAAGQEVPHLHFHVIPRNNGDGITTFHGEKGDETSLKEAKEKIMVHLD